MLDKIRGNITCWLPIMKFLRFPKDWPDCTDETEALELHAKLIQIEKETLKDSNCTMPCKAMDFKVLGNFYSRNAFDNFPQYNPKYYYLYLVYSTLTVKVLKEEHVYDFATALVAIGGSMGLLLGYSCNSLFSSLLDLIEHYCMERIHQVK